MSSIDLCPSPTTERPGGQRVSLNPRPFSGSFRWEMDDIFRLWGEGTVMEIIVSQEKSIPFLKGLKFLNSLTTTSKLKFNNNCYALFMQKSTS